MWSEPMARILKMRPSFLWVLMCGCAVSGASAQSPTVPAAPAVASPVLETPAEAAAAPATAAATKKKKLKIDFSGKADMVVTDHSPLIEAVLANDAAAIREALAKGATINQPTIDGSTPLIVAAQHATVDTMKILTGNGADVQAKDRHGRNALHYAAMVGDAAKATLLGALDADANLLDEHGISPLYAALYNKQLAAATALKDTAKADVNQTAKDGQMLAFALISYKDRPEVVKWMVDNGLNVFKRNADELTLMQVAKRAKHDQSLAVLQSAYDQMIRGYIEKQKAQEEAKKKRDE